MLADDVDEEDRRPTQRRRLEEAQAGGFNENMEPLVSCCYSGYLAKSIAGSQPHHLTHSDWLWPLTSGWLN